MNLIIILLSILLTGCGCICQVFEDPHEPVAVIPKDSLVSQPKASHEAQGDITTYSSIPKQETRDMIIYSQDDLTIKRRQMSIEVTLPPEDATNRIEYTILAPTGTPIQQDTMFSKRTKTSWRIPVPRKSKGGYLILTTGDKRWSTELK